MAGRHSAKSSKAPIVIVFAVILFIFALGVVVFFMNTNDVNTPATETINTLVSEQIEYTSTQSESAIEEVTTVVPVTEEQGVTSDETVSIDIVVPTQEGEDLLYFNATYSPIKAVDKSTDNECPLKEVFGSSYSGGVIIFNNDGTFIDQIISSKGAYVVSDDTISAIYVNDKNMNITVNSWHEDKPSEFIINYGGYDVYFKG